MAEGAHPAAAPAAIDQRLSGARWWLLALAIVAGLAGRLVALNSPPIGHHSWRQADTAGVARNFAREDANILHPRVDWRGDGTGRVEMEFPAYPWVVSCVYRVIGEHTWAARVLSVLASLATVWMLVLLAKALWGDKVAVATGCAALLLPTLAFFSRTIMPEAWMLCAQVAAVWFMLRWSKGGIGGRDERFLWLSALAAMAACLLKLPSLIVGLPLLWLAIGRLGVRGALLNWRMWAYAVVVLGPTVAWYAYAAQVGRGSGNSFGVLGGDKWGHMGLLLTGEWWKGVVLGKVIEDHLAFVWVVPVLAGLVMKRAARAERVVDVWMLACVVYFVLVPRGNLVHDYYQMPLLPALALYAGLGFVRLGRAAPRLCVLVACAAVGLSGYTLAKLYRKELSPGHTARLVLAADLARSTAPGDLVAVVDDKPASVDPTILYAADRKGWVVGSEVGGKEFWQDLRGRGCRAVAVFSKANENDTTARRVVAEIGKAGEVRASEAGVVVVLRQPPRREQGHE